MSDQTQPGTWKFDEFAELHGFEHVAQASKLPALLADNATPGISSPRVTTALAGVVGTTIAFALALLWNRLLLRKPSPEKEFSAR